MPSFLLMAPKYNIWKNRNFMLWRNSLSGGLGTPPGIWKSLKGALEDCIFHLLITNFVIFFNLENQNLGCIRIQWILIRNTDFFLPMRYCDVSQASTQSRQLRLVLLIRCIVTCSRIFLAHIHLAMVFKKYFCRKVLLTLSNLEFANYSALVSLILRSLS